jgi:protease-4
VSDIEPTTKSNFWRRVLERVAIISISWVTVSICLGITLFIFIIGLVAATAGIAGSTDYDTEYTTVAGDEWSQNYLLSIPVTGTIAGSETGSGSLFDPMADSYTSGYAVKEQIKLAAEDDTIKGIVLEINSPGGTIYGARAIADAVEHYKKETGKPVYAFIEGQAASGGYWAAVSANKIIADFGSDIGSIGVIMGPFQYYDKVTAQDDGLLGGGVVTQNGIQSTYISAGTSKDIGNPYRKLTSQELASLQQSVNNEYEGFVQYVSRARVIPADTIKSAIGAMSYDNKTAQDLKLIDVTGSRDAAYDALAKEADLGSDFQVIQESYIPGFLESMLEAIGKQPERQAFSPCAITRGIMVYHGDVAALCRGRN